MRRRDGSSSASRTSWTRTRLARPNRRCCAIGKTPSEWGSRCGRYGTRICRCCSSSGRIRSPYTWPPLRRPTTWTGTHSSAAGRGYEPTRRCSPESSRPLDARVAFDNVASRRVLEKCGFRVIATERNIAEARSAEIEELVLRLDELASPIGADHSPFGR